MSDKFNSLYCFFEDTTIKICVREYARLQKISPPTASTRLHQLSKEGLLSMTQEYGRKFFSFTRSQLSIEIQRVYWSIRIKESGLITALDTKYLYPLIILFGSHCNGSNTRDSDLDLAVVYTSSKEMNLRVYEKKLNRKIDLHIFKTPADIPKNLKASIKNGHILSGRWKE
ncbi:MAG: putative nucleotidyltransferase [Candidatus Woesearchaeota archaeon]|jgi:predicted nucleotidyltransferase